MDGQIHDIEAEVGLAGGRRRIREWRGGIEEGDRGIWTKYNNTSVWKDQNKNLLFCTPAENIN